MKKIEHRLQQAASAPRRLVDATEPRFALLRFELITFLLIVATFGAVLLKDAIIDRHFAIGEATVSHYSRYWYSDGDISGTSSIGRDSRDPLKWRCVLTGLTANRYCGFGILLDVGRSGMGRDFSVYDKVTLDLDYLGPSRQLKLVLKNADPRYAGTNPGEGDKPNVIEFPAKAGRNHVELNLRDAAVEQWWINAHPRLRDAGTTQLNNVVAIDVQTGTGAVPGVHRFALQKFTVGGAMVTAEHWYLILLGCWTGLTALYLVHRVRHMRRDHAVRHERLLEDTRLLQHAHDAAERASEAKSRFLAHMSHELRTPLNAILGYARILRTGELSHHQNVAARTIQESGEHLLALSDDILDLSRIEAGKLMLMPRQTETRRIVRGVVDIVAVRAEEKGLCFTWDIAPDVPNSIVADDKCLRQILLNLLGNAIKFTSQGEVRLCIGMAARRDKEVTLRFEVKDTGAGIAADQMQLIFEPFEQVGDFARRAGGSGLGLNISRRIVELMNGRIDAESLFGAGSRFWFEITVPLGSQEVLPPGPANDRGDPTTSVAQ
jgi:signal transduction histidine kinase